MLFGIPNFPALIAGSFYVKAGTNLLAEVTDYSGANNSASLMARGLRHTIQQGSEAQMQLAEQCQWNKYRSFLPYVVGMDTPFQDPSGPGTQLVISLDWATNGDFFPFTPMIMVTDSSGAIINNITDLVITSWSDGQTGISIVDPTILPIPVSAVFSQVYSVAGFGSGVVTPVSFPGGFGGNIWNGGGHWTHKFFRGTTQKITLTKNFTDEEVFVSIAFPGYLATCDAAEGEFLTFPGNQGQISRNFQQQPPGGGCGPTGPCPPPGQRGRVIVGSNCPPTPTRRNTR
jgi:hypothetical protein